MRIVPGKGYGFVDFKNKEAAELCLSKKAEHHLFDVDTQKYKWVDVKPSSQDKNQDKNPKGPKSTPSPASSAKKAARPGSRGERPVNAANYVYSNSKSPS